MVKAVQQFGLRVINGQERSLIGRAVRVGLTIAEPFYAGVMRLRNWCFDHRIRRILDLGRPTISVGNITTGGTGKTPVVLWLANAMRERGHRPAVLLRGYGSTRSGVSDEQTLLAQSLNDAGSEVLRRAGSEVQKTPASILVRANPSRVEAAKSVLLDDPSVDLFILDDGFQHRKATRTFDLVLISAVEPFGYDHVLPRGLLREPLAGLKRASAFLITHSSPARDSKIEAALRDINAAAPIFRADHIQATIRVASTDQRLPIAQLSGENVFVFAGIGDPESFARQLESAGCAIVAHRWFADHHPYVANDIDSLAAAAKDAGASWLLTTQKDWVKIAGVLPSPLPIPIGVVELSIAFADGD
jgi:tetraacyldisaccharide 4'-kinase